MTASPSKPDPRLISFQTLRKSVGWLGILLPAVMIIGNLVFRNCSTLQNSISHYYYTVTGNLFVGILCAVALFLISYRGYDRLDHISSSLAGIFAVAIAMFPTNTSQSVPVGMALNRCVIFELADDKVRNSIHYISAALFFTTLAYISFFLFTKNKGAFTKEKRVRNKIYRVCAVLIILSILLIAVFGLAKHPSTTIVNLKPVFWLEWIALLAFGTSWLVKGELVLKDGDLA